MINFHFSFSKSLIYSSGLIFFFSLIYFFIFESLYLSPTSQELFSSSFLLVFFFSFCLHLFIFCYYFTRGIHHNHDSLSPFIKDDQVCTHNFIAVNVHKHFRGPTTISIRCHLFFKKYHEQSFRYKTSFDYEAICIDRRR